MKPSKPLKGYRVVKSGQIKSGDQLAIGARWHPADGSIGHEIGAFPWHQIGDVIRRLAKKKVKSHAKKA
jgi:hypothetical protein